MLSIYESNGKKEWKEEHFRDCCYQPPLPDPNGGDCCYNTWNTELTKVNWELSIADKKLQHVTKHLGVLTDRTSRLEKWYTELDNASQLTNDICQQLEIIEAQLNNICINTEYTIKAIKILFCMVREFYIEVDCLNVKYECLMNCIKCLNTSSLSTTQGIGKALSDYGAALNALIGTRDALLKLVAEALAAAEKLHWEICDSCGFSRLITDWQETLKCGIPCDPVDIDCEDEDEPDDFDDCAAMPNEDCLFPILSFPICQTAYYNLVARLYRRDKKLKRKLTERKQQLTKWFNSLTAGKASLTNALKEVTQTARCS
jgi:hypothetical protein